MLRRLSAALLLALVTGSAFAEPLPGTKPLTREGDLATQMVAGIDRYLMRELAGAPDKRRESFKWDHTPQLSPSEKEPAARARLRKIIGVVDERVRPVEVEFVGTVHQPPLVAETATYRVYAVRWPVLPGVDAEGLYLEPKGKTVASVVALPDADWTPEMFVGLTPGVPRESQAPRHLAENGCRVLIPTLIDRQDTYSGNPKLGRATNQPHREFIYRMAYQMGRHIIGYEAQKVLAAVDWFLQGEDPDAVGVIGHGEGGLLALYSMAVDPRIKGVIVSGYFGPREKLWDEPIYRNVWNLLPTFGDAELASMRHVIRGEKTSRAFLGDTLLYVEAADGPTVEGPPAPKPGRGGAAPGRLTRLDPEAVQAELKRLQGDHQSSSALAPASTFSVAGLKALVLHLARKKEGPLYPDMEWRSKTTPPTDVRKHFDPAARQKRQFDQLVDFTQKLMRDSEARRAQTFWAKLDTSSVEKYEKSTEPFRKQLWEELMGKLPAPTEPVNPLSRQILETPKWTAYEVTLDLYPNVFAYGILTVPKDLAKGERRPVVVCQHGLEGRPTDVVNPKQRTNYYNSFGSDLADKGYVVFAPQNPYIGRDAFRVLQRKANPLGLSLFSFIIRQHERILDWLATQPFVDPEKMAFYGLSYGGKTAMRVPAVLPRYCLSICSGDFNEWTWKNASVDFPGSYMFTIEYEMPEFNLGQTLVYAEMAALIAPRPFMVERGHDDGVGIDEWVAYEYAKVRRLYSRPKLPERTEIEFFAGRHEIHSQGTFAFLQKHLGWPK
jgi:dienelactone hydrolase